MAPDTSPPRGRDAFHLPKVITKTTRLHEAKSLPELTGWDGLQGQTAIRERGVQNLRARRKTEEPSRVSLPEVPGDHSREVRNTRTPPLVSVSKVDTRKQSSEQLLGSSHLDAVSALLGREENVKPGSRGVIFLKPINSKEALKPEDDWLSSPRQVTTPRQHKESIHHSKLPLQEWRESGTVRFTPEAVRSSFSDNDVVVTHSVSSSCFDLSPRILAKVRGTMDTKPGNQAATDALESTWRKENEYFAIAAAQLSLDNPGLVSHLKAEQSVEDSAQQGQGVLETAGEYGLPPGKRKAVWSADMLSAIPRAKTPITINESFATAASQVIKHELEGTLLNAQPPNSPHAPPKLPYSMHTTCRDVESVPAFPSAQQSSETVSPQVIVKPGGPSQYKSLPKEVRTGEDAVKYLSRGLGVSGGPQLLFLDYASKRAIGGFDPYELQVVPPSMAGSEHFTMSSSGVVHLIEGETSESIPLSVWMQRKSVYTLLKKITFFGKFALVKAFNTWRTLGRRERFAVASTIVQEKLLVCNSDRFRTALLKVKAEASGIGEIAVGSLLSRFGPPPYHEKHFNTLRDIECNNAGATAEEIAAQVLREVEGCCKAVIREVVAANAPPDQSQNKGLKKFELPDKNWKVESTSYLKQQKAEQERRRARALWHQKHLGVFVRCADAIVVGEIVQAARFQCKRYMEALAISRPRGLLHLTGSMEEIAPLITSPDPEPPNPVAGHDDSGRASLALRVLDHEGLSTDMEIDSAVRESATMLNGVGSGSNLSGREEILQEGHRRAAAFDGGEHCKQPTFGHRDFSLPPASQSQQVVSHRNACSESAGLGVGQPGPATRFVFEPSFDDVAQMLDGVLQGIVRALTSGSARLALTKELQAVVGHVDRSAIPHPKAIVSEAVNLEGLVQQLRNSVQEHVQRVMASEAVSPYVTTGPLCDFATQWSPESYMASSPSPQHFCRDAKLMQSWLFTIQKAKTSFATDLLMVDTQKAKAKLLPLAGATLHGLAVLMGEELKRKIETCKEGMDAAIALLRSMPVEIESFLKFVETVQPHLLKGHYVRQAAEDIEAISAMKDLLAQIPDPAASKSAQVAAAYRSLKETQEDYLAAGDKTRAHIRKQAEAVHVALERTSMQLCEQLRQELLSLRVGSFVDPDESPSKARDLLAQKFRRLKSLRASANLCTKQQALLGYDTDRRIQHFLSACEEVLRRKQRLWEALCEWAAFVGKADAAPLLRIGDFLSGDEVKNAVGRMEGELGVVLILKTDNDQLKSGTNTVAEERFAFQLRSRLATWQHVLPVVVRLCNGRLRSRHLAQFQKALGLSGEVSVTALLGSFIRTLEAAADAAFAVAQEESELFDRLQKLKMEWQNIYLEVKAVKAAEHVKWPVLGGLGDLMRRFAESQSDLARLMTSPFCGGLAGEIEEWEEFLAALQTRLEDAADCQELLDFFGRIFAEEDARNMMPTEHQLFQSLSNQWAAMMTSVQLKSHLLACAQPTSPLAKCAALRDRLSEIQSSFTDHLDTLRAGFPRLYLLSDSELLALAAARDFTVVNHLVNKCFPGVSSVILQTRLPNPTPTNRPEREHVDTSEHYILTAVEGPRGENLTLNRLPTLVRVPARVDRWMGRLLEAIRRTLAVQTKDVLAGKATKPAGQSVLLADAIRWTADVELALADTNRESALKALSIKLGALSESLVSGRRTGERDESRREVGDSARVDSCRLAAVKSRQEVLQRLIEASAGDVLGEWRKEVRYTWHEKSDSCTVHMGDFSLPYEFEYLPSSPPFVSSSPAALSLFEAISTGRFVAQVGPDQGGVNTFAELARACGRWFVPSACTAALDYRSTARLLTGAAESGAWLSLMNVNALAPAVTSVLAQQLHTLKEGVATRTQLVSLEGADILLHPGFAFAISLPRGTILDHLPHLQTLIDWTCHVVEDSVAKPPAKAERDACEERERLRALLAKILSESRLPFETEVMASKCLDLYDSLSRSTAVFLTGDAASGKSSCWKLLAKALSSEHGGLDGVYSRGAERGVNQRGKEAVNVRVVYPGALTQEELLGAYAQNHQWENGLLPSLCAELSVQQSDRNGAVFPGNWVVLDGDLPGPHWDVMEPLVAAKSALCLPDGERFKLPAGAAFIVETLGVSKLTPAAISNVKVVHLPKGTATTEKVVSKWVANLPSEVSFLKGHITELARVAAPIWNEGGSLEPDRRLDSHPTAANATTFVRLFEHFIRTDVHVAAARKLSQSDGEDKQSKSELEQPGTNITGQIPSRSSSAEKRPGRSSEQSKAQQSIAEASRNAEQMASLHFVFCLLWAIGAGASAQFRSRLDARIRALFTSFGGAFTLPEKASLYELRVCSERRAFVPWMGVSSPAGSPPITLPGCDKTGQSFPQVYVPTTESESVRALLESAIAGGLAPLLIGPPSSRKSFIMQLAASNVVAGSAFTSTTAYMTRGTSAANLLDVLKAHLVPGGKKKAFRTPLGKKLLLIVDDMHIPLEETKSAQQTSGSLELLRQFMDSGSMYSSIDRSTVEVIGIQLAFVGDAIDDVTRLNKRAFTLRVQDPPSQSVYQSILESGVKSPLTGRELWPSARQVALAASDALTALRGVFTLRLQSDQRPTERRHVAAAGRVINLGGFVSALQALRLLQESQEGETVSVVQGSNEKAEGLTRKREPSSDLDLPNFMGLLKKAQKSGESDGVAKDRREIERKPEGLGISWADLFRSAVTETVGSRVDKGFREVLDSALRSALEKAGERVGNVRLMPLASKPANLLRQGVPRVSDGKGGVGLTERLAWRAKLRETLADGKEIDGHVAAAKEGHVAGKEAKRVQFADDPKAEQGKPGKSEPQEPARRPELSSVETFPEAEIHFAKLVDALFGGADLAVVGPPCSGKRRITCAALRFLNLESVDLIQSRPGATSADVIQGIQEAYRIKTPHEKSGNGEMRGCILLGDTAARDQAVMTWLSGVVLGSRVLPDGEKRTEASGSNGKAKDQQSSGNKISGRGAPLRALPNDTCPRFVLLCSDATWRALVRGFPALQKRLRVVRFGAPSELAVMEFADRGLGRVWDTEPEQPFRQRADWDFSQEKEGYLTRQNKINDHWRDRPLRASADGQNPSEGSEGFGPWAPSSAATAICAVYARARVLWAARGLEVSLASHQLPAFAQLAGGFWRGAKKALRHRRKVLEACLDRLEVLQKGLVRSNDDADGLQPALEALLAQSTTLLAEIAAKQRGVDLERAELARDDRELQIKLREIEALTSASQTELKRTAEVYEDALTEISHLARDDMIELKSFQTPPPLVKTVMEAVCLLMGAPPDWESARRLLADNEARNRLAGLDKDRIPEKTLKTLQKYVHHPSFTPAAVEQVSKACCSLCMWVLAVNEYAKARANVKEKGRRLAAVQRKVDEEAMRLQERRTALQAEESEMGRLKRKYVEVMSRQTEAEAQLADVYQQGDRSSLLLRHLAGRRPIWERQLASVRGQLEKLPGDAILAAGTATFLGSLTQEERKACLADGGRACAEVGVSSSVSEAGSGSSFGLRSWLQAATPATSVVRRLCEGLPDQDSGRAHLDSDLGEKIAIALYGHRPPLIVDPDGEFERLGGPAIFNAAFQAVKQTPKSGEIGPGLGPLKTEVPAVRWKRIRASAAGAVQKVQEALESGAKVCLQIDGSYDATWPELTVAAEAHAYAEKLQRTQNPKPTLGEKTSGPVRQSMELGWGDLGEGLVPHSERQGPHDLILYTTHPRPGAFPGHVSGLYNVVDFSVDTPEIWAVETSTPSKNRLLSAVAEHVIPDVQSRWKVLSSSLQAMRQSLQEHEGLIVSAFGAPEVPAGNKALPAWEDEAILTEVERNAANSEALTLRIEETTLTLEEVELSRRVYQLLSNRASLIFAAARALSSADEAHFVSWEGFKGLVQRGMGFAAGLSGEGSPKTERKAVSSEPSDEESECGSFGEASPEHSPVPRIQKQVPNLEPGLLEKNPYSHLPTLAEQLRQFRAKREPDSKADAMVERLTVFLVEQLSMRLTEAEASLLGGTIAARLLVADGVSEWAEWQWVASRGVRGLTPGAGNSDGDSSAGLEEVSGAAPFSNQEPVSETEMLPSAPVDSEEGIASEPAPRKPEDGLAQTAARGANRAVMEGAQRKAKEGKLVSSKTEAEGSFGRPAPVMSSQTSRLAELRREFPGQRNPSVIVLGSLDTVMETLGGIPLDIPSTEWEPAEAELAQNKDRPGKVKLPSFAEYLSAAKAEPAIKYLGILQHVALFQALHPDALASALAWLSADLLGAPADLQPTSNCADSCHRTRPSVESGGNPKQGLSSQFWTLSVGTSGGRENARVARVLYALQEVFADDSTDTPLVVLRSFRGSAVIEAVRQLAERQGLPSHVVVVVCLGQNHGWDAEEAIHTAQRNGGWVCILGLETEPQWGKRLCELVEEMGGGKAYTHPTFKVWVHYQLQKESLVAGIGTDRSMRVSRPLPEGFVGRLCSVVCID